MPTPNQITPRQLARLIGTPGAPIVIDLCIDDDFSLDPRVIPAAFRHSYTEINNLADQCCGRSVVVYCQKGKKISEGGAAQLRTMDVRAQVLQGGVVAWRDAGLPLVPYEKIPLATPLSENAQTDTRRQSLSNHKSTVWVTRHRPKIDRIACPWLIRRFIDPAARFLFVPPATVDEVAALFNAVAFDVEGAFWSHRGTFCTFDTMLQDFELTTEPLQTMATAIRAADTDNSDLAPQAAGLLAMSVGLSRMYKDDLLQLDAGMVFYDALYRWARDGLNEQHNWPTSPPSRTDGSVRGGKR